MAADKATSGQPEFQVRLLSTSASRAFFTLPCSFRPTDQLTHSATASSYSTSSCVLCRKLNEVRTAISFWPIIRQHPHPPAPCTTHLPPRGPSAHAGAFKRATVGQRHLRPFTFTWVHSSSPLLVLRLTLCFRRTKVFQKHFLTSPHRLLPLLPSPRFDPFTHRPAHCRSHSRSVYHLRTPHLTSSPTTGLTCDSHCRLSRSTLSCFTGTFSYEESVMEDRDTATSSFSTSREQTLSVEVENDEVTVSRSSITLSS